MEISFPIVFARHLLDMSEDFLIWDHALGQGYMLHSGDSYDTFHSFEDAATVLYEFATNCAACEGDEGAELNQAMYVAMLELRTANSCRPIT